MFYHHTVAVVIPAYKVDRWIARVIQQIPAFVDHIIVVDDCSPDNLVNEVNTVNSARVTLVRHQTNKGVGGAMKSGFKKALELGVDLIVKMDGDDQMDPKYLVDLLYPLITDDCDYTKGNRFGILSDITNMPIIRRIGNLILTLATKFASGYWHVVDSQNGYLAVKSKVLQKIDLNKVDDSYFFENSMLTSLNIVEARVSDVLIPSRYGNEISSMSISSVIRRFPFKLLKSFFSRIFYRYFYCDFSPVIIFFFVGSLLMGGGIAWGLRSWYISLEYHHPTAIGTFSLGLIPILLGFQFCMNALILDMQQSPKGSRKLYEFSDKERENILVNAHSPIIHNNTRM